jgi:hypothetical protein
VTEVQVGGGGVESGFDAEGAAGFAAVFEALAEVGDADDLGGAFLKQVHLFVYGQEFRHVVFKYKVCRAGMAQERGKTAGQTHHSSYMQRRVERLNWGDGESPEAFFRIAGSSLAAHAASFVD